MKKLQTGRFSNGIEEFSIIKIIDGIAHLFTKTGIKFLRAKSKSSIKIGEETLKDFLKSDLKGFSKIDDGK